MRILAQLLLINVLVFFGGRPLLKMLLSGLRNGQFDGTKLSNARRSEDPFGFWGDGIYICFWLALLTFGWVFMCWMVLLEA